MNPTKIIKVIEVISPYQIILNCGLEDGEFYNEQRCEIYGLGKVIKDPDTGEDLETLEIIRGLGKITHIQRKICTVESTEFTDTPIITTRKSKLSAFGMGPEEETQTHREKMPFRQVQLGDLVRFFNKRSID